MLQHLTGQPIPGIPCCQTFSSDLAHRTRELLQQHEAVLTFLRSTIPWLVVAKDKNASNLRPI